MSPTITHPNLTFQPNKNLQQHGALLEQIDGIIKVYKDGHVERPQIMPSVRSSLAQDLSLTSHDIITDEDTNIWERPQIVSCVRSSLTQDISLTSHDIVIDEDTNIWARFYVPKIYTRKLPLLVYFHGGGFCVGSASWSCYHDFLAQLAEKSCCLIMSVNYRLAPENPLPAAYNDGLNSVKWLKEQALKKESSQIFFLNNCDFSSIYLGGDSAGANIAHNVSILLNYKNYDNFKPLEFKGRILIQPFFGGEIRTYSEEFMVQPRGSALSLVNSDTYWRLSLPNGSNRDHPWCNPLGKGCGELGDLDALICASELDILRDRNSKFSEALCKQGVKVKYLEYLGVGHAFQVLDKSQLSQKRTNEMIDHIMAFISSTQ